MTDLASAPGAAGTSPADLHTSRYTDLAATVRESGLLERRHGFYWTQIITAVIAFAAIWVGFFLLGDSWFQLLLAGALGIVVTQFGFLGHDAAHRQIFRSAAWNAWTSRVLAGAFAGLSYTWWRAKHNKHHQAPNQEGIDPDIGPGRLRSPPGSSPAAPASPAGSPDTRAGSSSRC